MFKLVQKADTLCMFANGLLLLLTTTIVPFPTALVATYLLSPAAWVAATVYSGLFVVINIAYNLLWWAASYQQCLLKSAVSHAQVKQLTRNYLLGLPGYLLALVCAPSFPPAISIGICSALWIFWALTIDERKPVPPRDSPEKSIQ